MAEIESDAEYIEQTFRQISLEREMVQFTDFEDCVFDSCSFMETCFRKCRFLNCTFSACNLNLIQVDDSTFSRVNFENSKLVGINWTVAKWPQKGMLNSIEFADSVLNHATFIGLGLQKTRIIRCQARDVDFSDANMMLADLSDSDFEKSRFINTNLTQADLRGAKNYQISPQLNRLKQARFSLPEAMSLLYSLDILLDE